jgi:hypothetical protein
MPVFLSGAPLAQIAPGPDGPVAILLIAFALFAALALFAFWLWMVLDCANIPPESSDYASRPMWLLVIFLVGWIGALLYFFLVRRPRLARRRARHTRSHRRSSGRQATSAATSPR